MKEWAGSLVHESWQKILVSIWASNNLNMADICSFGNSIYDIAVVESDDRILLIMLPGARNTPQQLAENGFIKAIRDRELAVDVMALDAHIDLYLDQVQIKQLLHQTLDQANEQGYRRIWLLGISLGGTGAMLCAIQRTKEIEGIFLLAPFLGTRGIIAEVEAAGGLQSWHSGEINNCDFERALLEKIQRSMFKTHKFPTIYLGFGTEDRFRGASVMLSELLPLHCVTVLVGGHDWRTWIALWQTLLDKQPFSSRKKQLREN